MRERVIFHVDANSAFLSWSAAYRVKVLGEKVDLREIPSVVAGDKASRQGVILAKSTPAKKYGIQTGEPLFQALEKCPQLAVVPPDYELYVAASRHFVDISNFSLLSPSPSIFPSFFSPLSQYIYELKINRCGLCIPPLCPFISLLQKRK